MRNSAGGKNDLLIDVTRLLDRRMRGRLPTGVDRVSLEYLKHFGARSTALVRYCGYWIELTHNESERVFEALVSTAKFDLPVRRIVAKALPRTAVRTLAEGRFLFNTGHSGLEDVAYARKLRGSGLRPLFIVYDLIPVTHPEYCRVGEAARHRIRLNTMLSCGHGVIAISAATMEEVIEYAFKNGMHLPPLTAALLAPAKLVAPKESAKAERPYFVVLGTIEPRKNHWLLLHLWRHLIEKFGDAAPGLVIIGQRGWECENVVDMLERCESLKEFVTELPACSDQEMVTWLGNSRALLFPSFAEGYGMPLVEALSLGVPVIASDLPAFREIAQDIPEYLDPLDGKRWEDVITDYATPDSNRRREQCDRMAAYVAPTWDAHFEQVEAFMERLSFAVA